MLLLVIWPARRGNAGLEAHRPEAPRQPRAENERAMDEIAGADLARAGEALPQDGGPGGKRAAAAGAPEAGPGSAGKVRLDGADPALLRHVAGRKAEQPVAARDRSARGQSRPALGDPDMRRPDAVGCDLARGVKIEHHRVGDEPGRDRRDEAASVAASGSMPSSVRIKAVIMAPSNPASHRVLA